MTAGTYGGKMSANTGVSILKAISIGCSAAVSHACILDGMNEHIVVYVAAGSGTAVSFTGLKITRGSRSGDAAGVLITSGSVTMTD